MGGGIEAGDEVQLLLVAQLVSTHSTSTEGGDEAAEGNRDKVWETYVPH